jgi:hypothetical protein
MDVRSGRWSLLVGALAAVPIVVIPDSWWYTAWYDAIGRSAVALVLIGVRGNRSGTPMTWWWLAAGQLTT